MTIELSEEQSRQLHRLKETLYKDNTIEEIVEREIKRQLSYYMDENNDVTLKKGYYRIKKNDTPKKCYIIKHCLINEKPYVRVIADGSPLAVPEKFISEAED